MYVTNTVLLYLLLGINGFLVWLHLKWKCPPNMITSLEWSETACCSGVGCSSVYPQGSAPGDIGCYAGALTERLCDSVLLQPLVTASQATKKADRIQEGPYGLQTFPPALRENVITHFVIAWYISPHLILTAGVAGPLNSIRQTRFVFCSLHKQIGSGRHQNRLQRAIAQAYLELVTDISIN